MARRDRRRREAGAFAASVLVHLALLAVLARVAVPAMYTPPSSPQPDVQLQLVNEPPPPATTSSAVRRPAATQARPTPAVSYAPTRRAASPAKAIQAPSRPAPPKAVQAPPAPPSHASASVPAAGSATGTVGASGGGGRGRWTVEGEDDGQDGVRKFLRATVGCSHEDYARLSPVERANCDRRVGHDARMMGSAAVDTVGSGKRGYYAAVQDAYQSLHDARPRYDANGNRVLAGRLPGAGCKWGGGDPPPGSFKVGPCFVVPPQGVGTEESATPPP